MWAHLQIQWWIKQLFPSIVWLYVRYKFTPYFLHSKTFSKPFSKFSRNCFQKTWRSSWLLPSSPIPSWQLILGFVTCISHFCHFSSNRKGHVNRSRGQIYGQIAALDSFPQWQDLTVAKVSCYWCLISLAQGSKWNSLPLGTCPLFSLSVYLPLNSLLPFLLFIFLHIT